MKQTVDWLSFWTGRTPGFHEGRVNSYLQQFLPRFNLQSGDTVFMPLCGKAVDILWLTQQGLNVIGVELSGFAIDSFFRESDLDVKISDSKNFVVYQAPNITLYQGDFMDIHKTHLQSCKLVYDRAAIVSIETFNRLFYTRKMSEIIPLNCPMLVVTLEYDQTVMQGPPFSVPFSEISELYKTQYQTELLQSNQIIDERPRWRERGLDYLRESALCLKAI